MKHVWGIVALCLVSVSANAALVSRLGGLAYYDTATNLTWVADANLANTTPFGVTGIEIGGGMVWDKAKEWIEAMNSAAYLGVNDWRMPMLWDTAASGCDFSFSGGTDCGYNSDLATGELARMYYGTLGNSGYYTNSGVQASCAFTPPCLTNVGPFSNLRASGTYWWYSTPYAPFTNNAWYFQMSLGSQNQTGKASPMYVWAVRTGDIDADNDGIAEVLDNCTSVSNPSQCDSDGDGYGNRCDADMNNNGSTNAQDTVLFRQQLGQPSVGPMFNKADLNCSGAVNAQDTTLFRQLLGSPPGPSGLAP